MIQNITDDEKTQIESDGGMNINQLNGAPLKRGIKPSAKITEKFYELDTNKNEMLEKSEEEDLVEVDTEKGGSKVEIPASTEKEEGNCSQCDRLELFAAPT